MTWLRWKLYDWRLGRVEESFLNRTDQASSHRLGFLGVVLLCVWCAVLAMVPQAEASYAPSVEVPSPVVSGLVAVPIIEPPTSAASQDAPVVTETPSALTSASTTIPGPAVAPVTPTVASAPPQSTPVPSMVTTPAVTTPMVTTPAVTSPPTTPGPGHGQDKGKAYEQNGDARGKSAK